MKNEKPKSNIALIVFLVAVAVVFYALGFPSWVFAVAALLVGATLLGDYYRRKPNVNVNRAMYILMFASFVGLAIFFALSAALVKTGLVQPSAQEVVVFAAIGLVIGGELGDLIGKRRGYRAG